MQFNEVVRVIVGIFRRKSSENWSVLRKAVIGRFCLNENILKSGEGLNIEFKENFCDAVIKTLVGFSNSKGGRVILGVNDKKEVNGVLLGKETLKNWQNTIKTKTEPYIDAEISVEQIDGKNIVILEVQEFPLKPVSFKGVYYIRKNNSTVKMNIQKASEMFLKTKRSSWDFYFDETASIDDLDELKIRKVMGLINGNISHKFDSVDDFLEKYELVKDDKVTNAAVLLFSKKGLRETDIQIGLFQDEITIKKDRVIRTDLISEVEEVMDFIKAYIFKEFIITGNPQREERWQYPIEAVRELVINAIVHRDYRGFHSQFKVFPEKLELINSGGLPFDLTVGDILKGSKKSEPRNRLIAEIFRDCGFIERYGSGIQRANAQVLEYGLPSLDIEVRENTFIMMIQASTPPVTPQATPLVTPLVTELEERIIDIIKKDNKVSMRKIAEALGIGIDTVKEYIKRLKDKGVLMRRGKTSAGYWEVLV